MRKQGILVLSAALALYGCSTDPATSPLQRQTGPTAAQGSTGASPDSMMARARRAELLRANRAVIAQADRSALPFAHTVVRVVVPSAWAVAVRADGLVAVANVYGSSITMMDVRTKVTLATIPATAVPTGIAYSPDGHFLYVAAQGNALDIIDANAKQRLVSVTGFNAPPLSAITSINGSVVYIGTGGGEIYAMDATTKSFVKTLPVGGQVNAMAVDSSGTHLYATDMQGGHVIEVNLPAMTVGRTWIVGGITQGLAVTPDGKRLVVLNETGLAVNIDLTTGVATLVNGSAPAFGMADAPAFARMFWTQPGTTNVQGFLVNSSTVIGTLSYGFGDNRRAAFYKPTRTLLVADATGSLAFIN
ncbi:MAG: hypothetical protein U0132_06515 [Gemmatimonadaceae bacterium]